MPGTVYHNLVATTPDDPSYEIRPSHWNDSHAVSLNIVGSEVIGAFKNDGGVSFGLDTDGKITAAAPPGGGGITNINVSAGTTSQNLSRLTFDNSNGISFGLNGSVITASHNGLTQQSTQPVAASGSNGSFQFSTLSFGNSNGISFYTTNGSIVATANIPAQSNQTLGIYASSQTVGQSSSSTVDARSLTIRGMGVASVGMSAGELIISVPSGGGAGDGFNRISAGTTIAGTNETVSFKDTNGISFGLDNGTLTASHNAITQQSTQPVAISGSNGSFAFSTVTFGNSNGLTFYTTNGSIVGSYTVPNVPAQTNQTGGIYAGGNTTGQSSSSTYDARSLSINFDGIVSGGWSNGSLRISANALTSQSNQALSGSNGSFTFQTATFGNLNGLSFYTSNGSIVGSYTVPSVPAQTNQTIGFYAEGNTTQNSSTTLDARTVSIGGRGNITVGFSNGTIQISGSQSVQTQAISAYATNNTTQSSSGTMGANSILFRGEGVASVGVSNGSVIISVPSGGGGLTQATMYATGNTTQSSTGTQALSSLIFRGEGVASVGVTNGSVVISVPSGGGGGFTGGMSTFGNTAGTTGLVSNQLVFVGSGPISLSQSVNGQSATLSIIGPATSSLVGTSGVSVSTNGSTISVQLVPVSRWAPDVAITAAGSAVANSSVSLNPFRPEVIVAASHVKFLVSVSGATQTNNSSAGMQLSASIVLYTRNGSTLSSFNSGSTSFSTWYSSNATGSFNGPRLLVIPLASATTLTAGEYWMAVHISTVTTGQTNLGKSISMGVIPTWQSGFGVANYFGSGQTNTRGARPGLAIHSTGATRASIAFSDITGHSGNSASLANLWFALRNYTIW